MTLQQNTILLKVASVAALIVILIPAAAASTCRDVDAKYHQSVAWHVVGEPANTDPCLTWIDAAWVCVACSIIAIVTMGFCAVHERNKISDSHSDMEVTSTTELREDEGTEMKVEVISDGSAHDNGLSAEGTLYGSHQPLPEACDVQSGGTISPGQILSTGEVQVDTFSPPYGSPAAVASIEPPAGAFSGRAIEDVGTPATTPVHSQVSPRAEY